MGRNLSRNRIWCIFTSKFSGGSFNDVREILVCPTNPTALPAHCVPAPLKNCAEKCGSDTMSNRNRFANFFHRCKQNEISKKFYVAICPLTKSDLKSLDFPVDRFLWSGLILAIFRWLMIVKYILVLTCQVSLLSVEEVYVHKCYIYCFLVKSV